MQEYIKLMKTQKCGFEWESWKHFNHHIQILQNGKSGIFQSEKLRLKEIFADIGCCTLHRVDSPTRVLILQGEPHEQIHIIQTLSSISWNSRWNTRQKTLLNILLFHYLHWWSLCTFDVQQVIFIKHYRPQTSFFFIFLYLYLRIASLQNNQ